MNTNKKLGLGGATFGGSKNNNKLISRKIFGNVSIENSIELIRYAYKNGIKVFDLCMELVKVNYLMEMR